MLALRDQRELEDLRAEGVQQGHLECLVQKEEKGQLVLMEDLDLRAVLDPQGLLEIEVLPDYRVQLDLLEEEDQWEHKEKEVTLESLVRRAPLDLLDYPVQLGLLDNEANGVKLV